MRAGRYVVLGLGRPRSSWFRTLGQWVNSSSIPVELVKCISAEELRVRLASGRKFSAVLVEHGVAAVDRDLVGVARQAGCPTIVVGDGLLRSGADLGVADFLEEGFGQSRLMEVLRAHAEVVRAPVPGPETLDDIPPAAHEGSLVALCGPGGTGTSSCAVALAQALADDPPGRPVLLADLARRSEQAMLHDAGDVVPGVRELVEAHRSGTPGPGDVLGLTYLVVERRYHLLLGLHRSEAWGTMHPRAFAAALSTLLGTFGVTVCDTDSDVEGEREGGSIDVEERNVMSRQSIARADVVLAVGRAGMKGVYSLSRVLVGLLDFGVPPATLVPVITRAPRQARGRAELHAALTELLGRRSPDAAPVFLPDRRVEDALRDGTRLPAAITAPLLGAFRAVLERGGTREPAPPEKVEPGSLGGRGLSDSLDGVGTEAALR